MASNTQLLGLPMVICLVAAVINEDSLASRLPQCSSSCKCAKGSGLAAAGLTQFSIALVTVKFGSLVIISISRLATMVQ